MNLLRTGVLVVGFMAGVSGGRLHSQSPPSWTFTRPAQDSLAALWSRSLLEQREEVACLGGTVGSDTVRVERALPLRFPRSDSLTADAEHSLDACGRPEWIGTAHTHIRSTDDPSPAPRFSPADRIVMSLWSGRWGGPGAFCVLYSEKAAHCEVYPPEANPRRLR